MVCERTNSDRLDSDPFFEMSVRRVIGIFPLEDLFAAESVYKCGSAYESLSIVARIVRRMVQLTCARRTTDHKTKLNALLDILLPSHLNLLRVRVSRGISKPLKYRGRHCIVMPRSWNEEIPKTPCLDDNRKGYLLRSMETT